MKHIYIIAALMVLVSCRGNVGGHHHHDEEGHTHGSSGEIVIEPEKAEKLGINTEKVTSRPFNSIIKVSGHIIKDNCDYWNIVASCSGKIKFTKNNLTIGSEVRGSETLFSVSSADMNNMNLTFELEKSRRKMEVANKKYRHIERLRKDKLATEKEYLEAREEMQIAKNDYNRLNISTSKKFSSPRNGYIVSLNVTSGQFVEEGSTIAVVSTGKDIIIEADIPARFSSIIDKINGASYVLNGQVYDAGNKISSSDIIEEGSTLIPVRFKTEKQTGLSVGTPIEVYVRYGESHNTIAIAKSAISEKYGKYYVYERLDEDCYKETEVELGGSDGTYIEVKSGLKEGTDIVTDGVYYVKMAGSSSSIPHGHSH